MFYFFFSHFTSLLSEVLPASRNPATAMTGIDAGLTFSLDWSFFTFPKLQYRFQVHSSAQPLATEVTRLIDWKT